jgi:cell division protein FtsZ
VVATGLSRAGVRRSAPLQVLRTGTDNTPFNPAPAGRTSDAAATPDYSSLPVNVPRVWGSSRASAAAKIDALSSGGMEDFEIPAFLRKQAD